MSTHHTQGPWEFDEDRFIVGRGGKVVVQYEGCGSHKADWPNKANKNLVLAAPDLLKALQDFVKYAESCNDDSHEIDCARKAISKALGE